MLDRVAAAPISWGICEAPGWGLQLPVDRVLAEARGLGITAMEQGALGWLPTDPTTQRAKLGEYGMQLLGGFVPLVLHDPAHHWVRATWDSMPIDPRCPMTTAAGVTGATAS